MLRDTLTKLVDESEAVNHEYLRRISSGEVSTEEMGRELLERYLSIRCTFVPFMSAILASASPVDVNLLAVRAMLGQNIFEETGCGNVENAHANSWKRLLRAVGLKDDQIENTQSTQSTLEYSRNYLDMGRNASTPFALGAFACANEYFGVIESTKLLAGCKKVFPHLKDDDLMQLTSHIYHDKHHARKAFDVLDLYVHTGEKVYKIIEEGVSAGLAIERDYYNSRLLALARI